MTSAAAPGLVPMPAPPARWRRPLTWAGGVAAALTCLAALAAAVVAVWVPDEETLARRAEHALQEALGVPVRIDALNWHLLPYPAVELAGITIAGTEANPTRLPTAGAANSHNNKASKTAPTDPSDRDDRQPGSNHDGPITVTRLTVVPELSWQALSTQTLRIRRAEVDGAVLPQRTLTRIGRHTDVAVSAQPALTASPTMPELDALSWQRVTWVPRHGNAYTLAGEASFDAQWRPRHAMVRWPDAAVTTDVTLARIDSDDRWTVESHAGGGSIDGELRLEETSTQRIITGNLAPKGVEVAAALAAMNRRTLIRGKASGRTTVSGRSATTEGLGALVRSLHTDTRFTMGASTLLRFDLAKAVRSAGTDTKGETPLESITGQMTTQNTGSGMVTRFIGIQARSGALTAVGDATLANRQVNAELAVDLVDGWVGVPLTITGPVTAIKVSIPASALAGAAVGTAVLPGVGTALGARWGAAIGRLFGGPAKAPAPTRPSLTPNPTMGSPR